MITLLENKPYKPYTERNNLLESSAYERKL